MTDDVRTAWLTVERLSVILGMLAMAFMAGANWHRIDGVESSVVGLSRQTDQIKTEYERKDVLEVQLRNIDDKLADIRAQIAREKQEQP